MAFEPVSREQLTLYQEFLPQFEGFNAQLVGISVDHVWCHEAFAREEGDLASPSFPTHHREAQYLGCTAYTGSRRR
jgi:alkyl hydroperoxide reductase subunit AhpC